MIDKMLNLTSEVNDARNGVYESIQEIEDRFKDLSLEVVKYKHLTLKAFILSKHCEHQNFETPYYYLKENLLGDNFVQWHKVCSRCGKDFTVDTIADSPPEGYEGAECRYYNNNI